MGALSNLLTHRHAELAKVILPTSIATGFIWTWASGQPLLDPYRWKSGEETAGEHPATKTLFSMRR